MLQFNKTYLLLILLVFNGKSFAQSDTLNQKDSAGLRQGYWIIYGKDLPEKGYCDTCKIEEGFFRDNRKTGAWTFYYYNGNLKIKTNFVDGRPRGYYEKYYENGVLMETGTYKQNVWFGEYRRYYENGCLQVEKYFDMKGNDSLPRIIYYPNCDTSISVFGSIQLKLEKSPTGGTVDSAFYEDGTYNPRDAPYPSGSVVKTNEPVVKTTGDTLVNGSGGPDANDGKLKGGVVLKCDGYMKVYNLKDEIWMDGVFKDCKLWEGKLYKYNNDGVLLKIEIWKNGNYHSDGQL